MQYGIRVVVAPSFGEIFYSNCFNNGLLAAKVSPEDGAEILSVLSETKPIELTINLPAQTIEAAGADRHWHFDIAPRHKQMLLDGLDMVDATLADKAAIDAFRAAHENAFPWMAGLPGKRKRLRDAGTHA